MAEYEPVKNTDDLELEDVQQTDDNLKAEEVQVKVSDGAAYTEVPKDEVVWTLQHTHTYTQTHTHCTHISFFL